MSSHRSFAFRLAVLLVAFGIVVPATRAIAATVLATTDTGPVQGVEAPPLTKFLGIPYAAPPVGAFRWRPPQQVTPWTTPRDASAFGAHCAQAASPFGLPSSAEDCLFLNVYVPNEKGFARDSKRRRPVMVWIHGGAFLVGESDDYDPTPLLAQGVVVVTINYRLGALGFLAHPALTAESTPHISGNYGILDQIAALQWVQRNIKSFGGNPHKVTIFGESAGGISVHALLASPLAVGLFQRAIVESGAVFTQQTLAAREPLGSALATAVGCDDQTAACLRGVSADDLVAAQGTSLTSSGPLIDGNIIPQPLLATFKSGQFNRVPVIEGSNHDEFRLFVALLVDLVSGPLTEAQYPDAVATILGVPPSIATALIVNYPAANYPSPGLALAALATDAAFACNAHAASRALSNYVRTYAYEFDDVNAPELFLPPVSFPYGAAHASEIQYLFDIPNLVAAPALTPSQEQLSDTMISYWTRFARTGRPNSAHVATRWPKFDTSSALSESLLSLVAPTPATEPGLVFVNDHKCGFWDGLLGN